MVWFGLVGWLVGWLVKSLLSYAGGDSIKMVPQPRNITPLDQSKLGPSRAVLGFRDLVGLVGLMPLGALYLSKYGLMNKHIVKPC